MSLGYQLKVTTKQDESPVQGQNQETIGDSDMAQEHTSGLLNPLESLADAFQSYTKDILIQIVRFHGFSGYSKFNKKELAQWLEESLMKTQYMEQILLNSTEEELGFFESAIIKNGILLPQEILERSRLLSSYTKYHAESGLIQVPQDVQQKYKEIATTEFRMRVHEHTLVKEYSAGAVYLYGVISQEKLLEIYRHYEGKSIPGEALTQILNTLCEEDDYFFKDGLFMDERLEKNNSYKEISLKQKDYPLYLPDDKNELLHFGKMKCQIQDKNTDIFMDYLLKEQHMDKMDALMLFVEVEDALRMNRTHEYIFQLVKEYECHLESTAERIHLADILYKLDRHIRKWDFNGHSAEEVENMKKAASANIAAKVMPVVNPKKIYPNEPCPCGSGKKYKKCCGR